MKQTTFFFTHIAILLLFVSSCGSNCHENEFNKIKDKYNYENIDDCLSNYEFEGARAFVAKMNSLETDMSCTRYIDHEENIKKIITAESIFLIDNGEYSKAIRVLEEVDAKSFDFLRGAEQKSEIIANHLDKIISELLLKRDYDNAKEFAFKASSSRGFNGYEITSNDNENRKSQEDVLLDKIQKHKKQFSK